MKPFYVAILSEHDKAKRKGSTVVWKVGISPAFLLGFRKFARNIYLNSVLVAMITIGLRSRE